MIKFIIFNLKNMNFINIYLLLNYINNILIFDYNLYNFKIYLILKLLFF